MVHSSDPLKQHRFWTGNRPLCFHQSFWGENWLHSLMAVKQKKGRFCLNMWTKTVRNHFILKTEYLTNWFVKAVFSTCVTTTIWSCQMCSPLYCLHYIAATLLCNQTGWKRDCVSRPTFLSCLLAATYDTLAGAQDGCHGLFFWIAPQWKTSDAVCKGVQWILIVLLPCVSNDVVYLISIFLLLCWTVSI